MRNALRFLAIGTLLLPILGYAGENLRINSRLNYSSDRIDAVGGVFFQKAKIIGVNQSPIVFPGSRLGLTPATAKFYVGGVVTYDGKDDTAAGFGDITYKLTDQFSIFAGARYT